MGTPDRPTYLHLGLVVEVEVREPVIHGVPEHRNVLGADIGIISTAAAAAAALAIAWFGGGGDRLDHDVLEELPRPFPRILEATVPNVVVVEDLDAIPACLRLEMDGRIARSRRRGGFGWGYLSSCIHAAPEFEKDTRKVEAGLFCVSRVFRSRVEQIEKKERPM